MNPIFAEARTTVDLMWIMGWTTAAFLIFFVGWIFWAWWPTRREAMRQASLMPFDGVDPTELDTTDPELQTNGAGR